MDDFATSKWPRRIVFGELPKADHPLGTHRRTPRYPHLATLILGSKTPVSQSEARAYNQLVDSKGCKASNDRGFYEKAIDLLSRKGALSWPGYPALWLSVLVSAGPCRAHSEKCCT